MAIEASVVTLSRGDVHEMAIGADALKLGHSWHPTGSGPCARYQCECLKVGHANAIVMIEWKGVGSKDHRRKEYRGGQDGCQIAVETKRKHDGAKR